MPPPKKKQKMTQLMQSPNESVSFEQFKRLVENLPDICFEVQRDGVAGDGKTLDECAYWYYEAFYTDPEVRKIYPYKLRSCPMKIRDKLLRMPESKTEREPVTEHQTADGVMVTVARMGTFIFPVTFFAFRSCVNVEQVLRLMGKTKEERKKLLNDEKKCYAILKRFYNMFYMFPDRQSTNIFKNTSLLLLSQLLQHGKPFDEMAKNSVENHAAEKKKQSIVSYEVFEKNLVNMYDIVFQLKLHDRNYVALDFEKCAQALYLAFYLKLKIRDKYTFKWRPCTSALMKRLLAIPDEEAADELRRSMPHLVPYSLELDTEEEEIEIDDDSLPQEPTPAADTLSKRTPEKNNNIPENQPEASEQVFITLQGVAYEYPVTLNCFLQFVNYDEVLSHLKDTNKPGSLQLSDKELMHRFYNSFYTNEKVRKRFKCSFNAAPPTLRKKLLAMAKPVNQQENQEVNVVDDEDFPSKEGEQHTEHSAGSEEMPRLFIRESSQGSEEEPFQTDVKLDLGKPGRFLYPVSFDTFRRCINYAEIIRPVLMIAVQNESQLEALIDHPRNPLCEKTFLRYYRSFYIFPDARQRYPYRFSCSDPLVLKKLIEYAKPLDKNALKTLKDATNRCKNATNVAPAPQSENVQAKEDEIAKASTVLAQESQNADHLDKEKIKENESRQSNDQGHTENNEKPKNSPPLPVTFHVFKRYVRNFNEILQKMQLCDEYKDKSETECAEEYYTGFYTSPEMRQKFECKFKPCPAKIRDLLLSYAQKPQPEESSQESECDVEFIEVSLDICNNVLEKESTEATMLTKIRENPLCIPVEESEVSADKEEQGVKETRLNPVSFKVFKRYVSNLKEIVNQMLLCDEHRGKSEDECTRDYYNGFYSSQEMRERFPYQLKPCPAKMRNKIISYPTKEREEHSREEHNQNRGSSTEKQSEQSAAACNSSKKSNEIILITETEDLQMQPSEIPVNTEESTPQNQTSNISQPPAAALNRKSKEKTSSSKSTIRTFKNGGSFEFPVSFETFKRHINYDEIIKSLLVADSEKDREQPADRGKRLFRQFYCSFYVQKEVRQSHPYRFQCADTELLKKLEEYAVPLNEVAKQTMSGQALSKPPESDAKDDTLVTLAGITYRFPVPFRTFRQYINYDDIKVDLANGPGPMNTSPEQLATILADETSCLRLLRRYYHSFYTRKKIRNMLKYNFNAAPPELVDKLLEFAKPIDDAAEPAIQPHLEPQSQPKREVSNVPLKAHDPAHSPVSLNVFLNLVNLEDVVRGMQQEPEYSTMNEDECKRLYYKEFYSNPSIRDKYPYKLKPCPAELRKRLLMLPPQPGRLRDHTYHSINQDLKEVYASRERELASKQRINVVTYSPCNLRQYITRRIALPEKHDLLERHILDSIKAMNATKNCVEGNIASTEGSLDTMSKSKDTMTELKSPAKLLEGTSNESQSRKRSEPVSASDDKTLSSTSREKDEADETPAKDSRELSQPDSAKTTESSLNYTKSSSDIQGPSTSSSTLRETEDAQDKRRENELKKCSDAERTQSTNKKINEATATNESPAVTKNVKEDNSRNENESQKGSELAATTSTNSKENVGLNATTEAQAEPNRKESLPDSGPKSKPNNPSASSDYPATSSKTQNPKENLHKRDAPTKEGTGTTSGTASDSAPSSNTSQRPTERQIVLEQAKKVFFAESSQDHNMTYLICTSQGLKKAIWRILYQLSMEEFKTYTHIHNGEDLYRNDDDLQPYYQHVVDKGNWPINLYVRLPMLRQLLHSKGVQLGRLNLSQVSPKILHWRELDEHTDFDKIVENQFKERTGEEINSVEQWFDEREQFYAGCWRHDQWIYQVPEITNEALHDEASMPLPVLDGIILKPLPTVESGDSQTEIISIASSSNMVSDSQSCPPTQLNSPNFVDIAQVDIHSQVPETPLDPLATQPEKLSSVKQEPIRFLNNLRGICNTDECHWEHITSEEQIVDLDASMEEGPSLSCFAIPKPSEMISPYQSLDSLLTATMFEDNSIECMPEQPVLEEHVQEAEEPAEPPMQPKEPAELPEEPVVQPEEPAVQPTVTANNVIQQELLSVKIPLPKPGIRKKMLPASNAVASKRPRFWSEKVPQLRHEFRPLPLNACVRIECEMLGTGETTAEEPHNSEMPQPEIPPIEAPHYSATSQPEVTPSQPPPNSAMSQPEVSATITPSQEFAQGNTLLQSSQLNALLDAPPRNVTVRKVNEKEPAYKNFGKVTAPSPCAVPSPLRSNVIFRKLVRFNFVASLTVQHIIQHRIEGHLEGATYQYALLKIDGRLCQVRGPLLGSLFPHLSPLLRSDLEHVLVDLPEFVYNCRWRRGPQDNTEDLRKRVLYAFMDVAPGFGQFRLQFDNASRDWATYSEIGRWDAEMAAPRPRCPNVAEKIIRPSILEKMREFKELMF